MSQMTTAVCPTQRWKLGRDYWRIDRDEGFRRADFAVDVIPTSLARAFTSEHHYSRSIGFALQSVGLFNGRDLVGVAVFSTPCNQNAIARYTGLAANEGLELGRFVLLNEVPYNAESFFIAGAFRVLRETMPTVRAVLAYSDPLPRTSQSGRVVLCGHVGIAYQACSGHYLGRASSSSLWLNADGVAVSTRGLSKIRLQERGASSAEKRFVALGASPRRFGQEPSAWIDEALRGPAFRKVRHPGNHVYCWPLGSAKQKRAIARIFQPSRAYPKQKDPEQVHLLAPAALAAAL